MYNVDQVLHLYVAEKLISGTDVSGIKGQDAASIQVVPNTTTQDLYFRMIGASKEMFRSDLIPFKGVLWAKATKAADLAHKMKAYKVSLVTLPDQSEAAPVPGQDYVLNVKIRQYISLGEDSVCFKFGAVRGFVDMTASTFYLRMAQSLFMNCSRDVWPLIKIGLANGTTYTWLDGDTNFKSLYTDGQATDTYDGIVIEEAEQDWRRGVMPETYVDFLPMPGTIFRGSDFIWGKVESVDTGDTIGNGKRIADKEWFAMGERGDQYHGNGYPHVIYKDYLVDPTKEYNTLDIHFCFVDRNEGVQKSEKDIEIVSTDASVINGIIAILNQNLEKQIATI